MKKKETALSAEFPNKLRVLRKNKGWSQGQLAQKIGADLQRVSKYERGVIWPTMELMVQIARVFEVSVDYLIRDKEDATISKIKNSDLRHQLEEVNNLPDEDQRTVVSFLDAFVKRRKFEELVHR